MVTLLGDGCRLLIVCTGVVLVWAACRLVVEYEYPDPVMHAYSSMRGVNMRATVVSLFYLN